MSIIFKGRSAAAVLVWGGQISDVAVKTGSSVIFPHGGHDDTHDYMKRMVEPLLRDFRYIFFEQRAKLLKQGL